MKFLYIIFLVIPLIGISQTYTGKVVDSNNLPIAYAEVVALKTSDDSLISGVITDDDGTFSLDIISENPFYIEIGFLGFGKQKITPKQNKLGTIVLKEKGITLEEVVIKGKKSIFKQEYDKFTFNVENSPLKHGYDGMEVLNRTPKIQINSQGNILLRNSSVLVLVNGRKMNMSGEELSNYLKSLNSENIKSIEIKDVGSAETDASNSGGVINVVLKKAPTGFQSTIKTYYVHRNKNNQVYFGGISNQFGSEKWNIYNRINYKDDRNLSKYNSTTQFYDNNGRNENNGTSHSKSKNFNTTTGIVFYPNDKHEIGGEIYYSNHKSKRNGSETLNVFSPDLSASSNNGASTKNTTIFYDIALNYSYKLDSLGSNLKLIADIGNNKIGNHNEVKTTYSFGNTEDNQFQFITNSNSDFYNIQADWAQKTRNNSELGLGTKISNVSRENTLETSLYDDDWQLTSDGQENFENTENIFAGYVGFATKINKKHQLKLGLRTEYTDLKGQDFVNNTAVKQNYLDWFPNLFYAYELKKKQTLSFSYSRRISRPSFRNLNPFVIKQNDYLYQMGNPDLKPQYSHKLDLSYQRKKQSVSLYANLTNDFIAGAYTAVGNVNYYKPQNFGKVRDIGIDYSHYGDITRWLYANISLGGWHYSFTNSELDNDKYVFYTSAYSQIKFSKTLFLNIYNNFSSKNQFAVTQGAEQYQMNLSLQKNIWEGAGLIRITWNDVFNTARDENTSYYRNFNFRFYQKRLTRSFVVLFVYTFKNKGKINNKKVKKNNDINNRL